MREDNGVFAITVVPAGPVEAIQRRPAAEHAAVRELEIKHLQDVDMEGTDVPLRQIRALAPRGVSSMRQTPALVTAGLTTERINSA